MKGMGMDAECVLYRRQLEGHWEPVNVPQVEQLVISFLWLVGLGATLNGD